MLFIGLWTLADREGRLGDRPKKIKMELLPCDDCDVDDLLQQLHESGLIIRYEVQGKKYIQVTNFLKHQKPHPREAESVIPAIPTNEKQCLSNEESCIKEPKAIPRYDQGITKEEPSHEKELASPAESPISESPISESPLFGANARTRDTMTSNNMSMVFEKFSNKIHPISGQIEADDLNDLINTYGETWVVKAIECAENGKSVRYIAAILQRWKSTGFDKPWQKSNKRKGKSVLDMIDEL